MALCSGGPTNNFPACLCVWMALALVEIVDGMLSKFDNEIDPLFLLGLNNLSLFFATDVAARTT